MSATKNIDAVAQQGGEFRSRVPPSEPLTTKGHAPGVKVGKDAAPDFSAQTLPPGSAPSDRTFQPSPISGQSQNPEITDEVRTSAEESIHGATSADLNKGIGQPMIGETSRELRHNAEKGRPPKSRYGLEGVGASATDPVKQRGLDMDHQKHAVRPDKLGAEDRLPEDAETVAAERD